MSISANLGFLWKDVPVDEGLRHAVAAGFNGVELHWRAIDDLEAFKQAQRETGGKVTSLNTDKAGGFGLCAMPNEESRAKASIEQALELAREVDCGLVHVTSGQATGPDAREAYENALLFACEAADDGTTIGIEPISERVVPGYFMNSFDLAQEIIADLALPNLKIIYDFYHAHLMGLALERAYTQMRKTIGSVQVCGLPDRHEPHPSELEAIKFIKASGYNGAFGAEYVPTDDTAGWLKLL